MKAPIVILSVLITTAVLGADCPTPKPLTCAQLQAKVAQRCPPAYDAGCPDCNCNCPPSTVVEGPTKTVEVPGPDRIIYQDVPVYTDTPAKGHPLFGGGPVYFGGLGATLVAGYQFKSGLQLIGGPVWVPQHGTPTVYGSVSDCDTDGTRHGGCTTLPYTVPGLKPASAFGAQVLAVYAF